MKTTIELRIDVDNEVIKETGYSVEEIEKVVLEVPFTNFRNDDLSVIVTLDNGEQIKFPDGRSLSNFGISVTYYKK